MSKHTRKNKSKKAKKMNKNKKDIKLTSESNKIVMNCLKNYGHLMDVDINNNKFIDLIFKSLSNASKQSKKIDYESTIEPLNTINLSSSYFLDKSIIVNLRKTLDYVCKVKFTIFENFVFSLNIYYNHADKHGLKQIIDKTIFVLCFCLQYLDETTNVVNFTINLYMGSDKKNVLGFSNKIEPRHINSGYYFYDPQTETSNITIFRKEEWFKTLIHECVHCFNLDFKSSKINFTTLFSDLFYINSNYVVNEAFTEFWARILNCAMVSYFSLFQLNKKNFKELYVMNLNTERCFSLYQSYKLLKLFGLQYSQIIDKTNEKITKTIYKETTNAFCYYIITSILMFNFDKTLKWFTNENYDSMIFYKTERQIMIFCYYLKELSRSDKLLDFFNEIQKNDIHHNTMRMSVFELQV